MIKEEQITQYRCSDDSCFTTYELASEHERKLTEVIDKTSNHGFKIGELVYIIARDYIRPCKIISIEQSTEYNFFNSKTYEYENVMFDVFTLHDLSEETITEYEIYYLDIDRIKRNPEYFIKEILC